MIKKLFFLGIFSLALSLSAQAQTTELVLDLITGATSSTPRNMFVSGSNIYFRADSSVGSELWISDGTTGGTSLLKDVNAGGGSSNPTAFFELNGSVYFTAIDNFDGFSDLGVTNGTEITTITTNEYFGAGIAGTSPTSPLVIGSTAYMVARSGGDGTDFKLVEFDGTTANEVPDIGPGGHTLNGSSTYGLVELGGKIILAIDYSTATAARAIFSYDPSTDTFTLIHDIQSSGSLTKFGSSVYYTADNGKDLYKTDGTTSVLVPFKSPLVTTPDAGVANPFNLLGLRNFIGFDGKLLFEGDIDDITLPGTASNRDQLFSYDPATGNTTDLSSNVNQNHDPTFYGSNVIGDFLYYRGKDDASSGAEIRLFRTDGTPAGTEVVTVASGLSPTTLQTITILNNKIYFGGDDEANIVGDLGNEFFVYTPPTLSVSTFVNSNISIYPNPSINTIHVSHDVSTDLNYEVFDITGRSVIQGKLLNKTINHNLNSGIYILKLSDKVDSFTQKIVVE